MLRNSRTGTLLAERVFYAESFYSRLMGLMGRKHFPRHCDAFVFRNCNSIHCFFMFMAIDVIFADKENKVVKCISRLKPWRLAFGGRDGKNCIELPAGTLEKTGTLPGDQLIFEDRFEIR